MMCRGPWLRGMLRGALRGLGRSRSHTRLGKMALGKAFLLAFWIFLSVFMLVRALIVETSICQKKQNSRDSRDGGSRDVISITP